MKKLLIGLMLSLVAIPGWSQTYFDIFGPAAGVQYNPGTTPFNSAATAAQIASPFGCSGSQALTGTGGCSTTGGSVTSVGFSDNSTTPIYTIGGTPVTSSGTITQTLTTQSANTGFMGPTTGAAAQPSFRAFVSADIPPINLGSTANGGVSSSSILLGANGGTSNGFFSVTGPATSLKTFTFPNASATVLTTNAAVTPTQGGTGLTSYNLGDTLYASASNTLAALAGNTTSTKKFLTQTGTGSVSAAPGWNTIASADVPAPGSTTQIIYNNAGALAGSSNFTYTPSTGDVAITAPTSGTALTVAAASGAVALQAQGAGTALSGLFNGGGTVTGNLQSSDTGQSNKYTFGRDNVSTGNWVLAFNGTELSHTTSTGNAVIDAPSSGTALAVTGLSGSPTITAGASSGAAAVSGWGWNNGITTNAWNLYSQSTDPLTVGTAGAATLSLGTNGTARATINSSGSVTVNAPSSGAALTVNGLANANTGVFVGSSTSGQSFGITIEAGTTSADSGFLVTNQAASLTYFKIFGDGGSIVGSPTGGNKGSGTLNTQGDIFINNVVQKVASLSATCTSGGCTAVVANGFSTSITRSGTGTYGLSFSPTFGSAPVCVVGSYLGSSAAYGTSINVAPSSTGVTVATFAGASAADEDFSIICNGI